MSTSPQDFNTQIIEEFRANAGRGWRHVRGHARCFCCITSAPGRASDRINPLVYKPRRDRYVVFASKAGAPTNPDWYHNLKAQPDTSRSRSAPTRSMSLASEASGDERDRLFSAQVERSPLFGEYQSKTDRVIPVIVLTPTA